MKIFIVEDHDEALKAWRQENVKNLDLVHIDAHLDFGFYTAKSIETVFKEAKTIAELKKGLEYSIAFNWYEDDFNKQTNIGNYIYPAMQEGVVRNFYWVIPGKLKEFKAATKSIKNIFKRLGAQEIPSAKEGVAQAKLLGRNFTICILERLPKLKQNILLDIDTDFLVIDSLKNANNTVQIGQRIPWILPKELVVCLKKKIVAPEIITIAYSVNGGYTPMKYKHLGDEIAYCFAPGDFSAHFKTNSEAARHFNLFDSTGKSEHYIKAVKLNPTYRAADNNYGPLYLALGKIPEAKKEFLKILKVDSQNSACLTGLGNIALEKKDFKKAKEYFFCALKGRDSLFIKTRNQALLGLGKAEFGLKCFKRAEKLLRHYLSLEPLDAQSYYYLGLILEKEKKYLKAFKFYEDAMRLGLFDLKLLWRMAKITRYLKNKDGVIKYLSIKYRQLKEARSVKRSKQVKKMMVDIEKILKGG